MPDITYAVDVVIEASSGAANRYVYDPDSHTLKLVEILYARESLPAEFGSIVGTLTDANTPLGVVVIAGVPIVAGALVNVRLIGGIEITARDNIVHYLVAVPSVDRAFDEIQAVSDLDPERVVRLEQFFQRYGVKEGEQNAIRWRDVGAIRRVLDKARRMGRMARVGERHRGTGAKAWQALVDWGSGGAESETRPYTIAEMALSRLPYRFQTYVAQMLLPDERILFFVERPAVTLKHRFFSRGKTLPEGLLVVTTQQALWMYDVLPPADTLVGYGYIAKTLALGRLVEADLQDEGELVNLRVACGSSTGGNEVSVIGFPRGLRDPLRHVVEYLNGFVPSPKAQLLCLAKLEATKGKLETLVESGDEKTKAALPDLTSALKAELSEGEFVVEHALVPTWAVETGQPKLVAVTNHRLIVVSGTRAGAIECDEFPLRTISSVELSHSVMECWLRVCLARQNDVAHGQVHLPLTALGQFTKVFLALRRGLTSASAFN